MQVGNCSDYERLTGVTVILAERGAVGGVDVRGSTTGTRETDLLDPINLVERVNAVALCGSSAYGLNAADGVMRYLEEKGEGHPIGDGVVVPIAPAAIVFDISRARSTFVYVSVLSLI
jgi:L-aminopeptidase/D-esterase-like protein